MPFFYFDPAYMLAIAPAMLLAMWGTAQVEERAARRAVENVQQRAQPSA